MFSTRLGKRIIKQSGRKMPIYLALSSLELITCLDSSTPPSLPHGPQKMCGRLRNDVDNSVCLLSIILLSLRSLSGYVYQSFNGAIYIGIGDTTLQLV